MIMAFCLQTFSIRWQILGQKKRLLVFLCSFSVIADILYFHLPVVLREYRNVLAVRNTDEVSAWLKTRQNYMQKRKPIKLFLFAYMRGGSSIAGELFNCDPSATMWYEPGDAFFAAYYGLHHESLPQNDLYFKNMTRRKLKPDELEAMLNFYNDTFSCNYEQLPPEAMAHYFLGESTAMDGYVRCMNGKRTKNIGINSCKSHIMGTCSRDKVETSLGANCHLAIAAVQRVMKMHAHTKEDGELLKLLHDYFNTKSIALSFTKDEDLLGFIRHGRCIETMRRDNAKCLDVAKRKCQKDKLRVVQVVRMKMEDLDPLIVSNPDLYVVHYTRDPRAIAYSRYKTKSLLFDKVNRSTLREAEFVCEKMREDIRQRAILEKKYPGVFTHFTYESLAADPERFARRMYATFNQSYPKQWKAFVAEHMRGHGSSSNFGISVRNATETAFKWRTKIPKSQLQKIASFCADVISTLGYEL